MFKSASREQIEAPHFDYVRKMPGPSNYFPRFQSVSRQDPKVKISSMERKTEESLIKISPCLFTLDEKYVKRQDSQLLTKLTNLDQIERNFNYDVYRETS